jgi:adenylate cyclase
MNDTGGRVLVVDDNEMNRDMLSRRVERQGHAVKIAKNGREALAIIEAEPIDLVLLDIMMPEMNGYEVLEKIKSDPTLRHIPVIMISAVDEIDSVVRCIEMGAEDYLPKPFNPVLLKARIGAALDKKQLRDQEKAYLSQIESEKRRVDELLHVILPDAVVDELKATNAVKPRRYENVAVLFCDIVGFTSYCDRRDPEEVIPHLQKMVEMFEELTLRYDLEKIKTIGDSYMTTGGLLKSLPNPVLNCIQCGLEMVAVAPTLPTHWTVRVGIHVGPVVAGVVGRRQYLFDVWGDTVNTAARIESVGVPNAVNISGDAWRQVAELVQGESRGLMNIRGKGDLELFRVDAVKLA